MEITTRNKKHHLGAIREYYLDKTGEVELTDKQEEIRKRLSAAYSLLCNYHSIQQAIPIHMKEHDVSDSTAYRDMRDAIRLFGHVMKADKEGQRYIVYEYAVKTYQLAAKNMDYKAMAMATSNMIKLLGLDKEDPEMPDFEKLQPSLNIVVMHPDIEQRVKHLLGLGPIDSADLEKAREQTIDVPHEEMPKDGK